MSNLQNRGFPAEWLEQLKSKNDIVTTISRYIPLAKKGKLFWCACPFHFEKTPSMAVNDVEQFYHCFGCGASGDVINFVEKMESVDFLEATKILAKSAGMELPQMMGGDVIREKHAKKELYLRILKEAAIHYRDNLLQGKVQSATDYLVKRDINKNSISRFGIGVSVGFSDVKNYLLTKGFKPDDMVEAGVLDKKNDTYFDAYSGRLIFPLINSYGNVVGFSGRLLEEKDFAKYKNTRDTLTFDKSKTVFAINLIKTAKQKGELKNILLVEGQIDVISLHQAGFNNAVACLGTALTAAHARELKRFSSDIVLCFDGDEAGKKATLRGVDIMLAEGLNCKVASMPDGFDPDEYIKKFGSDALDKLLMLAIEANDYKLKTLAQSYNFTSNEQKSRFVAEAVKILRELKTDSEREIYLKVVSSYAGLNVDIIRRDLNATTISADKGLTASNEVDKPVQAKTTFTPDAYIAADIFILASLLHKQSYAKFDACDELVFIDPDFKTLLAFIIDSYKKDTKPIVSSVFDLIDVDANPSIKAVVNYNFVDTRFPESEFRECILKNKQRTLQMEQAALQMEFSSATDSERRKEILYRLNDIKTNLAKLKTEQTNIQTTRREEN